MNFSGKKDSSMIPLALATVIVAGASMLLIIIFAKR